MASAKHLAKQLYGAIPFKQPLFKALRRWATPPERIYRHLHFKGVITVPVSADKHFRIMHHGYMIENELFWKGLYGWEGVSMKLWTRLCEQSQVILDIGANTGVYALVAQAVNPAAKVVAVEPVERIFTLLSENIALNGNRIMGVHAAASDSTGVATLYDLPDRPYVLSVSLNPEWNQGGSLLQPVEVPSITVTDLLERAGETHVDLLKIDVETHEPAVLRGFIELIKRDRPSMLIEILNEDVARRISALLEGLGYQYYNLDDVTWPPTPAEQLSKSDHFNFLVCQPEVATAIGT